MIGIEQQRITTAAKTKNVVAAIERFYGKWQDSLANVCEELGGAAFHAADHCAKSKEALIEVLTQTESKSVPDAVSELVATWGDRAEELAECLMGATSGSGV
jgi:hypothetical protein